MKIKVCLTPALLHLYDVTDKVVVVVDILRATSSIVTAFAYGVDRIRPVADVSACRALRTQGYLTAGERDGVKVADFDKGNSPYEYQSEAIRGRALAMTTTNGTHAIEASREARCLVVGAFLNLGAVAGFLTQQEGNVLIVCAGWKDHVNLEDSLFAGALLHRLAPHARPSDDAALAAEALFQHAQPNLSEFLSRSSHVQRLTNLNRQRDLDFCLRMDQYQVVPQLKGDHLVR